jgi:hypothetical protein
VSELNSVVSCARIYRLAKASGSFGNAGAPGSMNNAYITAAERYLPSNRLKLIKIGRTLDFKEYYPSA